MILAVADTHAVIWYLSGQVRLSVRAKTLFEQAAAQGDQVGVSAVTIAEIIYLLEKGRVPAAALSDLQHALDTPSSVLTMVPFDRAVAEALAQVNRAQVPDMPDRMIAATAVRWQVPIISRDARIRMAQAATIW